MATHRGTWGYRDRFGDSFGRTYFRRFGPGVVSSVGFGTYLGEPTDAVDRRYREALTLALDSGCNVLDTAINYRCQRSERVVGAALRESAADRQEVVVATKGGFVPFDGDRPDDPGAYVREEFVESGLVDRDDLVRGSHCVAPEFLDEMVDRSLANLGLDRIDLYYVHNPETQLAERPRDELYDRLEAGFQRLERRVAAGDLGAYGVATWEAFRVPPDHESYLSLPELLARAESAADTVGVDEHHLRAVQLPFNVVMADAFTRATQPADGDESGAGRESEGSGADGGRVSTLSYAHDAGLRVFTSASLAQGDLTEELPPDVAAELAGDTTAQRALNFARSAPGVTCSLVGASRPAHVRENLAAGTFDPMGAAAFDEIFE